MIIELTKLKPNTGQVEGVPANPRLIKKAKYQKLKQSLIDDPDFTKLNPILVYDNKTEYIVMGGNMRLNGAKELGWKELEASVMPFGTPPEVIRARIIKHNADYGEDDWDLLGNEWSEYPLDDWGLETPKDWNQDEVVEDEAPPVADAAVSKLGEIYQLGRHRVMCGSSTKLEDLEKLLDGKTVDSLQTDPPYGIDYKGKNEFLNKIDKGNSIQTGFANDDKIMDYKQFTLDFISIIPFSTYNTVYVWMSDHRYFEVYSALKEAGIYIHQNIIWVKNNHVLSMLDYQPKHEMCMYGWSGKHKFYGDRSRMSVQTWDKPLVNDLHPTMKPIGLIASLIKDATKQDMLVYDAFGGSGSTLIACEQLDRTCFMMELSEAYIDVIRKRWAKYVYPDKWEDEWEQLTPRIEDAK